MIISVIGTGNMGRALARGFVKGLDEPVTIRMYDINKEVCKEAAEEIGGEYTFTVADCVKSADYILMAVKPNVFDDALRSVCEVFPRNAVVLSIAAAVTCSRIRGILGENRPFVRIMPNTPAQVGAGLSAVCPVNLSSEQVVVVRKLFATCGEVIVCNEETLDNIGCVSGTGPAYVMLFIEAMADAAVGLGIKRDDALKIAAATVMGSGKLCLETGTHPAVLKDMVCSPGGTTIEGVKALEESGLRNSVIKAVDAAYIKTQKMKNG
ncbi:pyrroline-5-carboxylate reductase [Ruminococcaceae bacterium YRB3002]|nr:pyrroline-5-carboxylate reductase [Ruminococcaceae bacterium YRB3002]